MLSFEKGAPIAKIRGGPDDGRILRVDANLTEPELQINDMFDVIKSDMLTPSLRKRYDPHVLETVVKAVRRGKPPTERSLVAPYQAIMEIITDRVGKEYHTNEGVLTQTPNTRLDRECLYVAGPSGSGKSVYTRSYVKNYLERFPSRPVYVFSRVADDKSLLQDLPEEDDDELTYSSDSSEETSFFDVEDDHSAYESDYGSDDEEEDTETQFDYGEGSNGGEIRYVRIDDELVEDPIDPEELNKSLVIFDDIDTIPDKEQREYVTQLRNDLLETGRHVKCTMVNTSHHLTDYKRTRTLLNESTSVTFYPRMGGCSQIKRYLSVYAGMTRQQIDRILNLPSRWVTISRTAPMWVLYDRGCYLV